MDKLTCQRDGCGGTLVFYQFGAMGTRHSTYNHCARCNNIYEIYDGSESNPRSWILARDGQKFSVVLYDEAFKVLLEKPIRERLGEEVEACLWGDKGLAGLHACSKQEYEKRKKRHDRHMKKIGEGKLR